VSPDVSAAQVKELRQRTQAGVMDAKSALAEAEGDMEKAVEILRVKGQASAAKRAGRGTGEGVVAAYIHANRKIGAMVEVQCETDFVARNEDFQSFAYEVALHIAAGDPSVVSEEEISDEEREAERRLHEQKARDEGKPAEIVDRIVEGQLAKWAKDVALLHQQHVNVEKHDGKTIEELRAALAAKTGENIRIARFARFVVGQESY
jgi:elongation factor Ts